MTTPRNNAHLCHPEGAKRLKDLINSWRFFAYAQNDRNGESGNVFVFILIAIALFGALAFTFSRSSQQGMGQMSKQQAKIAAGEIMSYGRLMARTVDKLRANGCSEGEINFYNAVVSGYSNTDAPADGACDVFGSSGGKMTWQDPPTNSNDGTPWQYWGGPALGTPSTSSEANADLVMILVGVTQSVCTAVNTSVGISGIPVDDSDTSTINKFTGIYSRSETITGIIDATPCSPAAPAPNVCTAPTGCFQEESGDQRYIIYSVLINRVD